MDRARSLTTAVTLLLLSSLLCQWLATNVDAQMVKLGNHLWRDYAVQLRFPPEPPNSRAIVDPGSTTTAAPSSEHIAAPILPSHNDELVDDLLDDIPDDPPDSTAHAGTPPDSGDLVNALLADLPETPPDTDLPGTPPDSGAGGGDLVNELLADLPDAPPDTNPPGTHNIEPDRALNARPTPLSPQATFEHIQARRTPAVRAFSFIDRGLLNIFTWLGQQFRPIFILLLGIGGWIATAGRHHISLRPIRSRLDDRVAQSASLVANLLLLYSVWSQHQSRLAAKTELAAGIGLETNLWLVALFAMAVTNVVGLVRPRSDQPESGSIGQALLSIPLYAVMGLIAGTYFLAVEAYPEGLAVYLEKVLANVQLYLQVCLYIWVGMLLKRTRLAASALAIVRPWRLAPELLAVVVVTLSAVPTAYSGASGIFVIAAGAMIFRELSAAGARPSLALASTAMSGSMGVVLSPCLLVVIVSYLSPPTSDELFAWGRWVFFLSAALFAIVVLLTRDGPLKPRPVPQALRKSGQALRQLLPHTLIFATIVLLAEFGLQASLDVTSAAFLLPLALLPILVYDTRARRGADPQRARDDDPSSEGGVFAACAESSVHIGALLLLMALSAGLGGVIERAEVVQMFPDVFTSPVLGMAALTVVLVLIGMVMDPYGAVILVQATLAGVAVASGIDLVHFWMVVLVAFELGYLTPPVALNHLLTRQVTGHAADIESPPGASFWRRHERYLLPITVMTLTLIGVAFGPFVVGGE